MWGWAALNLYNGLGSHIRLLMHLLPLCGEADLGVSLRLGLGVELRLRIRLRLRGRGEMVKLRVWLSDGPDQC